VSALTPRDYADALFAQSACNLSGIVHSFSDVISKVWDEARAQGRGTDFVNRHSICRLFTEQIAHLTGAGTPMGGESDYSEAYEACEKEAMKTLKPGERPSWRTS